MELSDEIRQSRNTDHDVFPLFVNRWSPRAMTGEPISEEELMSLFEAARWAPSSFNEQPWRFVYTTRDSEHWDAYIGFLTEKNQTWCKNAAALIVIVSKENSSHNGKPNRTHAFSTGSAFQNLALQATMMNLVCHGMGGFDRDAARIYTGIPDGYSIEAMCAIGKRADKSVLPEELREREQPSGRKTTEEFISKGKFKEK